MLYIIFSINFETAQLEGNVFQNSLRIRLHVIDYLFCILPNDISLLREIWTLKSQTNADLH